MREKSTDTTSGTRTTESTGGSAPRTFTYDNTSYSRAGVEGFGVKGTEQVVVEHQAEQVAAGAESYIGPG